MEKVKLDNSKKYSEDVPKKKPKMTEDEQLAQIQIKSIEKDCLDRVFKMLCELQEEPSSDEDSAQKKYKKEIESRANEKKMKVSVSNFVSKTSQMSKSSKKQFKEDEDKKYQNAQKKEEDDNQKKGKIGVKAVRKVLRTLCDEYPKDEIDMMIWEVDENLDGYVSENEFEKMYKRCITDEKEQQPKKLFYLVQFLMYDKEKKSYITEEDTLEILYIRHGDKFNEAINSIFNVDDDKKTSKDKISKKEQMTFLEYAERMHKLSMRKRELTTNKRKIFCEKVKNEWRANVGK